MSKLDLRRRMKELASPRDLVNRTLFAYGCVCICVCDDNSSKLTVSGNDVINTVGGS